MTVRTIKFLILLGVEAVVLLSWIMYFNTSFKDFMLLFIGVIILNACNVVGRKEARL